MFHFSVQCELQRVQAYLSEVLPTRKQWEQFSPSARTPIGRAQRGHRTIPDEPNDIPVQFLQTRYCRVMLSLQFAQHQGGV